MTQVRAMYNNVWVGVRGELEIKWSINVSV